MNTALSAKGLNKYFHEPDTFQVLRDVGFEVKKGEFVAIVGKSGSGKSTLLYLLSTMDTNYQGSIAINGTTVTGLSQNELSRFRNAHIGFVFQFHYLLAEFSVLDNVMLPALKLGKKSKELIEAKAMELLTMLDIRGHEMKKASKISGGQQQRVAIARALINEPAIIMGDEPTGNLDSQNTKVVFDIFRQLAHETGQTIIAVTHDDEFAANCDRIIEMVDGKIMS
ncbi:lipoprotein-releasing system ATP-binding protein [Dyadobacter sp. BE34]|uniref:Lipoprotein-releasing system ATP-binding protein n=1 Tax=Dyadobacter fermentans TaxID=94254 RepID=A0ABU1R8A4_9BACT|nr:MULTISPECIES: ABC transporter ATP-binding protein [Dyadobacter]MDR6809626.1 lipoprotein-releasing system ATP-binding protein [Dyadobacter fermentans]MDR7047304.1 lipoprotein-releasing system ATP-binding protein [Dyadobacter sp. BE242]MDR7201540.1 lipoprotein-releasing system ATP-binding protein [Dyadobacter sp. BE34]MDR7219410.1 lipoprotein-releasing system ATP-binding protein [Dyadobacter sp. BE31]MDR7267196.1 lipoprotein-releasing system ATP-binding protein [Dyadobacter sp. BE32]